MRSTGIVQSFITKDVSSFVRVCVHACVMISQLNTWSRSTNSLVSNTFFFNCYRRHGVRAPPWKRWESLNLWNIRESPESQWFWEGPLGLWTKPRLSQLWTLRWCSHVAAMTTWSSCWRRSWMKVLMTRWMSWRIWVWNWSEPRSKTRRGHCGTMWRPLLESGWQSSSSCSSNMHRTSTMKTQLWVVLHHRTISLLHLTSPSIFHFFCAF